MSTIYRKGGMLYAQVRQPDGKRRGVALGLRDTPENRVKAQELAERLPEEKVFIRAPKREAPLGPAVVYFIQEGGQGFIKIGFSMGLNYRLDDLGWATPHELKLLCAVPGSRSLERELHKRFAPALVKGEWFRPTSELLALVDEYRATVYQASTGRGRVRNMAGK
jgi:hypothetical protein